MSEDFLPTNYKLPTSDGGYMKLEAGDNKFRIMSSSIVGYELWVEGKPKRYHEEAQISIEDFEKSDKDKWTGEPRLPKHFWAFVVWNYKLEKLQILEIDKNTIQKQITAIVTRKTWGSPVGTDGYDLVITKEGEEKLTKYGVVAEPKEKLDKKIVDLYNKSNIKLDELFTGGNPFSKNEAKVDEDIEAVFDEIDK